jgi:uncharacterized protein
VLDARRGKRPRTPLGMLRPRNGLGNVPGMPAPSDPNARIAPPHRAPARALVVFARAPELGRVKTRLAAAIGDAAALACYRELGERVTRAVATLRDCRTVVAFTPREGRGATVAWLGEALAYEPQCDGDLGDRMADAVARHEREGASRIVVVGTDCPDVDAAVVEEAFARLDDADVVLGPALDGGYYLIALRAPVARARRLFEEVPWSAPDTLAVTLQRAEEAGVRVTLLAPLRDVDTVEDLEAWRSRSGGGVW